MTELISRYGPPQSTLTDNGLVFTTRLTRYKGARGGFEKLLAAHGITQKSPSATPGNSATSASAKPTPAHRCSSSSTTETSSQATRTPGL